MTNAEISRVAVILLTYAKATENIVVECKDDRGRPIGPVQQIMSHQELSEFVSLWTTLRIQYSS